MALVEKQIEFLRCVARLILWGQKYGYDFTLGEGFRTAEQAEIYAARGVGIKNSNHRRRLAIDLNLFIQGEYIRDAGPYEPAGRYWKTLHPLARWGGDFKSRDAVHFSFEHNGVM